MENRYNLIDEKWILSNVGRVSLMDCFTNDRIYEVGGTATQKLCILKLMFAIGQASNSFVDEEEIASAGIETVRGNIVSYLNEHHDQFWMYGERPFLQFPRLAELNPSEYCVKYLMNLFDENAASGGNGVYVDSQIKNSYDDADKANLLLVNLGSPVRAKPSSLDGDNRHAGKKKEAVFTKNKRYVKRAVVKNGMLALGVGLCCGVFNGSGNGILHGFVTGRNVMQTVYVNILSDNEIDDMKREKGVPPWEIDDMDEEHDYKETYYAYLVPMNRFMLFGESDSEFRCTEGIQYYKVEGSGKDMKIKYGFIMSQPDIFVYEKKLKKDDDEYEMIHTVVVPSQREGVIYSLRPFIESHAGAKETVYNRMINHSNGILERIHGDDKKNWRGYGIEYVGTEYSLSNGLTYRVGYADKRFGYGTKIGRDEQRMIDIAEFIGDETFHFDNPKADHACAIIERTIYNLKNFYLEYVYKTNDENCKVSLNDVKFSDDVFRQKCRCLIREAEAKSVNGDFNVSEELARFRKDVDRLAIAEIGLDNCHDRGRKIEIAYNAGLRII